MVKQRRVGKYILEKTLGRGTFSKVKYAIDTTTNIPYAIKIIDRKKLKKDNMEAQLKREIAIMKLLKQDNIVELKEVLQSSKHIYIVLELVTGGELFDRIVKEHRFSENVARKFFQQLITGVRYCHSQGISHRDLKPGMQQ
jgi:serine/threonine protein kinase